MLLIDCISDLHMSWPKLPGGDILIVAGDMTYMGKPEEVIDFNSWLKHTPYRKKVVIAGNHDFLFERDPLFARSLLDKDIIYLNEQKANVLGVKMYGAPITPMFNRWAFMRERGEQIKAHWDNIPENLDILITHGPPKGILDEVPGLINDLDIEHAGCEELLKRVRQVKPKYHVFGHIHNGYGRLISGGTTFINCAQMSEEYKPINSYQRIVYDNKV